MTQKIAIGIQSTFNPPTKLSEDDWRLYIKLRSMEKVKTIRHLTGKIDQILKQSLIH